MAEIQSGKFAQVSIKDRLKHLKRTIEATPLALVIARVPRKLFISMGAFTGLVGALMLVSFSLGNVISHQGYETVSFATPAADGRLIRQAEVNRFGSRVSNAFGIKDAVATEFADWILEASERQNIKPEILASLVVTESSFRKIARSNVGAIGPTQIRPDYWGDFCGEAALLHDPEQNVYCGAQVLSHMLERCDGNMPCALASYNVGPYARKHRENAANRYVKKIDGYLSSLEERPL